MQALRASEKSTGGSNTARSNYSSAVAVQYIHEPKCLVTALCPPAALWGGISPGVEPTEVENKRCDWLNQSITGAVLVLLLTVSSGQLGGR